MYDHTTFGGISFTDCTILPIKWKKDDNAYAVIIYPQLLVLLNLYVLFLWPSTQALNQTLDLPGRHVPYKQWKETSLAENKN